MPNKEPPKRDHEPSENPLTEPIIVNETLLGGMEVEVVDDIVRFVGWAHVPAHGNGETSERRIVQRFAMHRRDCEECCRKVQELLAGDRRHH